MKIIGPYLAVCRQYQFIFCKSHGRDKLIRKMDNMTKREYKADLAN